MNNYFFHLFQAIAFFAVVAVAYGQHPDAQAETLRRESVVNPDSFNYAYETSNGIAAKEQGQVKQIGAESGIAAQGDFGYTSVSLTTHSRLLYF